MRNKIILAACLAAAATVIVAAQFHIPSLYDADGYLHIRMASFIRQYGLKYDFHWARYSVFARNFADKDLLYHIWLIPFTFFPDIFSGAKTAAAIQAVFFCAAFAFVARRYCRQWLVPFLLLALFLSAPMVGAMSRARPMILVIALTILFVDRLINKKFAAVFAIAFIYALSHVSAPFLLVYALIAETVRWPNEKRFFWKNPAAALAGLILGFLIHPNFPNNLLVFYLNGVLVPVFAIKWGLELGAEFFPISTREFVLQYPLLLAAVMAVIAFATQEARRISTATKIWLATASVFFVFGFFSQRYIVHAYPLILISAAAYVSDCLKDSYRRGWLKNKVSAGLVIGAVLIFMSGLGVNCYKRFKEFAFAENIYASHYAAAADWMRQNIARGELIFHANWSDSQYFIGMNPNNDYFVTLDPIYMYYWDKEKYRLYREVAFGKAADPYTVLKETFKTKFGYAGKLYFSGLINQIRRDDRFEVMAEDGIGAVFRLR